MITDQTKKSEDSYLSKIEVVYLGSQEEDGSLLIEASNGREKDLLKLRNFMDRTYYDGNSFILVFGRKMIGLGIAEFFHKDDKDRTGPASYYGMHFEPLSRAYEEDEAKSYKHEHDDVAKVILALEDESGLAPIVALVASLAKKFGKKVTMTDMPTD